MHAHLREAGIEVGEILAPFSCPTGELRTIEPDGHGLMITGV